MKKFRLIFSILFIFLGVPACFSQIAPDTYVYDSIGVRVDVTADLSDTLTTLPNTHAKIRLPKFFEYFAYKEFKGYMHKGTSSTIIAYEYPQTSVLSYVGSLNDSVFKAKGMEIIQVFSQKQNNGDEAKIYVVRMHADDVPVIRIMCFTGNYNTMYYLMATVPEAVSKLLRNVVLASFQTLEY